VHFQTTLIIPLNPLAVARNNIRVKLGDVCNLHACSDIQYGKRVHIVPFDDSIEGLGGNIFDVYLKVNGLLQYWESVSDLLIAIFP
jgi:hypothetical protein